MAIALLTDMARRPRDELPGGVHHVYARGNRRQPIFVDDDDRKTYLGLLGATIEGCGWQCLAYCLMDNHVHLLLRTPRPNLGAGIGGLHGRYAQAFNRRHDVVSHLFHRPFGSKPAPDDATVMYFAMYIALNPVRARMTEHAEAYAWSSHAATLGRADPPTWLDVETLLLFFGGSHPRRRYAAVAKAVAELGGAGFDPITAEQAAA